MTHENAFVLITDANQTDNNLSHAVVDIDNDYHSMDDLPELFEWQHGHNDNEWLAIPNTAANRKAVRAFLAALEEDAEETPEASLVMLAEAHGFTTENYDEPTGEACDLTNGKRRITLRSEEVTE